MGVKYEKCVSDIKKKLKQKTMRRTYKCDAEGNSNKRGKHKCLSNPRKICAKLR
ncbi:MAG: hypothetical protein PHF86_12480 [Candidatus Nanoarchaeia archaeon]|nr:hypothetical protein [Candidatus Nanoarchaeia archaeon]